MYAHGKDDLQAFRFFFSNLINQGLCTKVQVRKAFSVTEDYVNRAYLLYKKEGEASFFKPENRHGYSYKLIGDTLKKAQQLLDEGHCLKGRSILENEDEWNMVFSIYKLTSLFMN